MRTRLLLFCSLLFFASSARGQDQTTYLAGQRLPTQVSLMPVYQEYEDRGLHISEFSTSLAVFVPAGRNLGFSLYAGQARASGTLEAEGDVAHLNGFTDVQVSATYYQEIGSASLVAGVAANLPSGKQAITTAAFETLTLLSRTIYDFQTPGFGQGFGLSPSLSLAVPIGERMVLGVGASYQYQGAFEPLADMEQTYDPGDEVLLTAGFDVGLAPQMSLSGDVSYTRYSTDTVGDENVFAAGDKVVITGQYRAQWGYDTLSLLARHRLRGKSAVQGMGGQNVLPTQTDVLGQYRKRIGQQLDVGVLAEVHLFEATDRLPPATVFDLGIAPTLRIGRRAQLPARFVYSFGHLSGVEVAVGLLLSL